MRCSLRRRRRGKTATRGIIHRVARHPRGHRIEEASCDSAAGSGHRAPCAGHRDDGVPHWRIQPCKLDERPPDASPRALHTSSAVAFELGVSMSADAVGKRSLRGHPIMRNTAPPFSYVMASKDSHASSALWISARWARPPARPAPCRACRLEVIRCATRDATVHQLERHPRRERSSATGRTTTPS